MDLTNLVAIASIESGERHEASLRKVIKDKLEDTFEDGVSFGICLACIILRSKEYEGSHTELKLFNDAASYLEKVTKQNVFSGERS